MATPPKKQINSLIVDTGPLIHNTISISTIIQSAERIYTTPAIISEIRDAATRSRVETTLLPFLTIRSPTPASYEHVAQFSKKTGDYPVLSRQDLGILALAYEVDEEVKKEEEAKKLAGEETQPSQTDSQTAPAPVTFEKDHIVDPTKKLEEGVANLQVSTEPAKEDTESRDAPKEEPTSVEDANEEEKPVEKPQSSPSEDGDDAEDSDGEWITPTNLKQHQAKDNGVSLQEAPTAQLRTATMTTDYAMQNVLLQMQLSLISPSMQRIQTLRTYILRCHACFLTTKDMTKQFCPRCGQPTLNRVSCTTNAKGEFKIHLAKNHQWNKRGDRYSVPKPQAGTASGKGIRGGGKGGWGNELVLAEDQKEYVRAAAEQKRTKTRDLMDEDHLPGILTGERGRQGGRTKVGAGKNINSRKRH